MLEVKEEIRGLLERETKTKVELSEIKVSDVGDLSTSVAFKLASSKRKKPSEVADDIAGRIKPAGLIKKIEPANGYINFYLDYSLFTQHVLEKIRADGDCYGKPLVEKEGRIILEHTSVNPSGPIHVGRLRNTLIGDSLKRILSFAGYDVETRYWVNDVGKQVAIIALGLEEKILVDHKLETEYGEYKSKDDFRIFFEYVAANRRFEEDEGFQKKVQKLILDAESGDVRALAKMKKAAEKSLRGQKETFKKLGVEFDRFDFESSLLGSEELDHVTEKLRKHRLWIETEAGFGVDLGGFGLGKRGGATILLRKDGTTVYLTRDLTYHLMKLGEGDRLINVLGEDHKFEFQELKTILSEVFNLKKPLDVVHYSFVSFEGGKLSTRRGETAPVDQLIDEATEKAEIEIEKRKIAGKNIASTIGVGAVKYHIIKTSPTKPIEFSWADALSFDGEAAPYIQYAHARSCRILEKAGDDIEKISLDELDYNLDEHEKKLVKVVSLFPGVVLDATEELKPNVIANYLYGLAAEYSRFYKNCPVIQSEIKIRSRRLLLVNATRQVIKTGLGLLGIDAPERM